jgi:hypothetical protein
MGKEDTSTDLFMLDTAFSLLRVYKLMTVSELRLAMLIYFVTVPTTYNLIAI